MYFDFKGKIPEEKGKIYERNNAEDAGVHGNVE